MLQVGVEGRDLIDRIDTVVNSVPTILVEEQRSFRVDLDGIDKGG